MKSLEAGLINEYRDALGLLGLGLSFYRYALMRENFTAKFRYYFSVYANPTTLYPFICFAA